MEDGTKNHYCTSKEDGINEFSTVNQDLTQLFVPKDQLADQKEDGKTTSTNSQEQKKDKTKHNLSSKTTTAG